MRCAVIGEKDGTIQNVVEWDGETPFDPGEGFTFAPMTDELEEAWQSKFPQPEVPARAATVTRRQLLLWLFLNKAKSEADILSALNTIADASARQIAIITFNNPDGPFSRSDPLFDQLAPLFKMTAADIDAAFAAAAGL